jgi:2-methylcitrate dehydratase PrpD
MNVIRTKPHHDDKKDYSASVTVTLKDGTELSEHVITPRGRGPENPLTDEDLKLKFGNCASRLLPADRVALLYERLSALEESNSLRGITSLMEMKLS